MNGCLFLLTALPFPTTPKAIIASWKKREKANLDDVLLFWY